MDLLEKLKRPDGKTLEFKRDLSAPEDVLETIVALREAVINAVVHTDYAQRGAPLRIAIFDDRLEVENRGLLPFGLTVEDLPHGVSKLRNRLIGCVLHALGLIEQWGSGIQRMSAACLDAGPAAPVFEELATRFRVTLATARVGRPVLDETDQAILARLAGGKGPQDPKWHYYKAD